MVEHLSLLEPRPVQHDTGDKGTEHRLDPEGLRGDAEDQHGHDDDRHGPGDVGTIATHPPQRPVDHALTDGHGERKEDRQAADGSDDARGRDLTGRRKAGEDREHDPPDDIVGHAGGNRDLAEVATHQAELAEDLGDHRECGDGKGGGDEQGENGAIALRADERLG